LPKRVSIQLKQDFVSSFLKGTSIEEISNLYKFSSQTIIKNLKSSLGEVEFKKTKLNNQKINNLNKTDSNRKIFNPSINDLNHKSNYEELDNNSFIEILPILTDVNFKDQKEITSKPILNYKFPCTVYMLINKTIELEIKTLRDYPEWSFLPEKDLNRMCLEIFDDHNYAKKLCSKNQKLIKIPNPNVFSIASDLLKSKGITRIIFNKLLLAL
tara:strand:- start:8 stop:646 length:639 start_codon:yes stop_codon:yes gene_type:complete